MLFTEIIALYWETLKFEQGGDLFDVRAGDTDVLI